MRSNRLSRSRVRLALVLGFALLVAVGCRGPGHKRHHARHHGFSDDRSAIQVVTTELGGKNVFIPSTIVVTAGHPVKLSIFNTTDVPHGFAIPALNIAEVLPAKAEHEIELTVPDGNKLLKITCHLHAPHRTATLVVLPAKADH